MATTVGALDDEVGEWIIWVGIAVSLRIVYGFYEFAENGAVMVAGCVDGGEFVAMVAFHWFGFTVGVFPFVDVPGGAARARVKYD